MIKVELHYKVYSYSGGKSSYYMTLNGIQFGSVYFSEKEVKQAINNLLKEKEVGSHE